jgi:hypothetical protein
MDQLIVVTIRLIGQLTGLVSALSIRLGERLKSGLPKVAQPLPRGLARSAAEGLAARGVPAIQPGAAPPASSAHQAASSNSLVAVDEHALLQREVTQAQPHEPDELDWAGSINHAVVASLHMRQVLAMVRAGWLVADEARLAEVGATLDALEAFQDRTEAAVAPLLSAMTEAQRIEFFEDFWAEFPIEHRELED